MPEQAPIGGPSITSGGLLEGPSPVPASTTQLLRAPRAPATQLASPVSDRGLSVTAIGLIVGISVPIVVGVGAPCCSLITLTRCWVWPAPYRLLHPLFPVCAQTSTVHRPVAVSSLVTVPASGVMQAIFLL